MREVNLERLQRFEILESWQVKVGGAAARYLSWLKDWNERSRKGCSLARSVFFGQPL